MREKLHVSCPVIVEGKYDKITLGALIDAPIFVTGGFSVFNSKEEQALLRKLAAEHDVILLTDSDGGGRQIRSFLLGILPPERVHQVFIPRVPGKERRKKHPGKSGTLGVEGMEPEVLVRLFAPFADGDRTPEEDPVTKTDLYLDGFSGGAGSAEKRRALCEAMGLPPDMTANALLEAISLFGGRKAYEEVKAALRASYDCPADKL